MASTTGTIFTLTIKSPTRTDASLIAFPFFPLHLCSKAAQEPAMSALLERSSSIRRALYRDSGPVQNMGVDHGRGDIRMSQELLHRPDVIVCFKQMRGKGVPEGMAADLLAYPGPQSPFSLFYLPVLETGTFTQVGKKGLNILARAITQSLSRQKINIGLRPFDIKERTIRPHPVLLHTGLKHIPKFLSRCRLLWTFFIHKSYPIQGVNVQLRVVCRQNYYMTFQNTITTFCNC